MPSTTPGPFGDMDRSTLPSRVGGLRGRSIGRRTLLAGAIMALSAACAEKTPAPRADAPPRTGGTLRIAVPAEAGLAPYTASYNPGIDGNRMSALYDPLMVTSSDTGGVYPHLALDLVPNPDYAVWTLHLRPGVVFSDGTALDAEAVKFNWEQHLNPALRSPQAPAVQGLRLKVTAPLVLQITLPSPNANFDHTVSRYLSYIGSPTAIRADPQGFARKPVGAGPFMLAEWVPGVRQTFVRNPRYWQAARPFVDSVVFSVCPRLEQTAEVLTSNEQDVSIAAEPQSVAKVLDAGVRTELPVLDGALYLMFNNRHPPFNDPRARRAVALTLSSAEINNRAFDGYGRAAHGFFSAHSSVGNPLLAQPEDKPAEARALFRQLADEGKTIEFTYEGPKIEMMEKLSRYLVERLAPYPEVSFRPQLLELPDYVGKVLTRLDYKMSCNTLWLDSPDPGLHDFVYSGSPQNLTGYHNALVDKALERARMTTDKLARREAYQEVQIHLNEDLPFWAFQEAVTAIAARDDVSGIQAYNDGIMLFDRVGFVS